jgi:hypothetical protein
MHHAIAVAVGSTVREVMTITAVNTSAIHCLVERAIFLLSWRNALLVGDDVVVLITYVRISCCVFMNTI